MKIYPSILTNNPNEFRELLKKCSGVDKVQIDINDGSFLGEKSVGLEALKDVETDLLLEIHLMVKEPINFLEKCLSVGAARVIAQIELMSDQVKFIEKAAELELSTGFALDIDTPVSAIEKILFKDLDAVLVMNYKAGKGGQSFNPTALGKIEELTKIKKESLTPFSIVSDGAVSTETMADLYIAGVDEAVVGRRLFEGELQDNISRLLATVHEARSF